jgi:hypothetical protein
MCVCVEWISGWIHQWIDIKLTEVQHQWGSQNSILSTATRLRAGQTTNRCSIPGMRNEIFLFSEMSRRVLVPIQPSIQWVPWTLYPGVKCVGHEADHSPPYNAKVQSECGCTFSHPACLLGVDTDNFTSILLQIQLHDEVGTVVAHNWGGNVTFYCYDALWSNTVQLLTKFHTPLLNAHNWLIKEANLQSAQMKHVLHQLPQ